MKNNDDKIEIQPPPPTTKISYFTHERDEKFFK